MTVKFTALMRDLKPFSRFSVMTAISAVLLLGCRKPEPPLPDGLIKGNCIYFHNMSNAIAFWRAHTNTSYAICVDWTLKEWIKTNRTDKTPGFHIYVYPGIYNNSP